MSTPEPNTSLRRLHQESGWTLRQLAQEVSRLGTERGTPLKYRSPSVHQWLSGQLPKEDVRPLILEAFSRRLKRPVTRSEAGFPVPGRELGIGPEPGTTEGIVELGLQDVDPSRRGVLGATLFSVAFTVPNWADVVGRMEAVQTGQSQRIGMADVEAVKLTTDRPSQIDDDFGGRYARPMAAAFLVNTVAPHLRVAAADEIRQSMLSAASTLCYLTGWMAVDEGLHGLAQRYYAKGLELAGAGDNYLTYCHILRGISVQAVNLGHGPAASRLADAAASAAPSAGPRMRAFLGGQQAHSYAVAGDRNAALLKFRAAETAVEQAESPTTGFGGYNPATLAYHASQMRYALGDIAGSIVSLEEHFTLRDASDSHRSKAMLRAILAERQLESGHLERACHNWSLFLEDYSTLQSGRADDRVRAMSKRIRPYQRVPAARALYERARAVVPAKLPA